MAETSSVDKPPIFDPQSIEDWGPYNAPIDRHPVLATIWFAIVCVFLLGLLAVNGGHVPCRHLAGVQDGGVIPLMRPRPESGDNGKIQGVNK